MQIIRYCVTKEEHEGENVFKVHRGYIMGNPYTHIKQKATKAEIVVPSREEAIKRFERYFEKSLELNPEFSFEFQRMVEICMKHDIIYIGCYCGENETCHGDYIAKRLKQECRKRLLKKIKKERTNEVVSS